MGEIIVFMVLSSEYLLLVQMLIGVVEGIFGCFVQVWAPKHESCIKAVQILHWLMLMRSGILDGRCMRSKGSTLDAVTMKGISPRIGLT